MRKHGLVLKPEEHQNRHLHKVNHKFIIISNDVGYMIKLRNQFTYTLLPPRQLNHQRLTELTQGSFKKCHEMS